MEPQPAPATPGQSGLPVVTATTTADDDYDTSRTVAKTIYKNLEDETIRRRKVRWGIMYVFLLDVLTIPVTVVLTFWVPGIAFAPFFTILFVAFVYYSMLFYNLRMSTLAKALSTIGLIWSFLCLVPFLVLAIYSILVYHHNRPYFDVVYSICGSIIGYAFHFFFALSAVALIIQHLSKPLKVERTEAQRI